MTVLSANWIPAFWNGGISPSFGTRRVIASSHTHVLGEVHVFGVAGESQYLIDVLLPYQ